MGSQPTWHQLQRSLKLILPHLSSNPRLSRGWGSRHCLHSSFWHLCPATSRAGKHSLPCLFLPGRRCHEIINLSSKFLSIWDSKWGALKQPCALQLFPGTSSHFPPPAKEFSVCSLLPSKPGWWTAPVCARLYGSNWKWHFYSLTASSGKNNLSKPSGFPPCGCNSNCCPCVVKIDKLWWLRGGFGCTGAVPVHDRPMGRFVFSISGKITSPSCENNMWMPTGQGHTHTPFKKLGYHCDCFLNKEIQPREADLDIDIWLTKSNLNT